MQKQYKTNKIRILYLGRSLKKKTKIYYRSLAAQTPSVHYVQIWGERQKMELRIIKLSLPVKLHRKRVRGTSESRPQNTARTQWIERHSLLTQKRYHYLQDHLIWRQAYQLQLKTLQTPSLSERNDSLLQQAVLQRKLGVILSDNGPRNNTELKQTFQYRSFVPHYVTIVSGIFIWIPSKPKTIKWPNIPTKNLTNWIKILTKSTYFAGFF